MDRTTRHNSYQANGGSRPNHHMNYNGKNRPSGGYNRISPTTEPSNNHTNHHDDLITYIFESWEKVNREDVKYFQCPRPCANFTPFDLEALWSRRRVQSIKRQQHNS
ncbi:uncharacterized protein LOC143919308 [Arctopsyche grandis]|uniref:uncharacterized protein LOC143919308 n=1 Tax=Arctopsyche grandis TaxID=121162 RepID=UPI00406D9B9B